jgi:hypothetical protein
MVSPYNRLLNEYSIADNIVLVKDKIRVISQLTIDDKFDGRVNKSCSIKIFGFGVPTLS